MKNVGVRFHDGSEVAYYGSENIQGGTDKFFRVLSPKTEDGTFVILAMLLVADIKEIFEVNLDEQTIDPPQTEEASHEAGAPDILRQADGVGSHREGSD